VVAPDDASHEAKPKPEPKPAHATPADEKPKSSDPAPAIPKPDPFVLGYVVNDIDGVSQDLAQYKGKVLLIVNVASNCGFTPQYKALQKVYTDNKDKGLVILGFPANNFRGQEPGSNSEIKEFCTKNFGVTFPMFAKVSVAGEDQHPLFKHLAQLSQPPAWNFNKYLVDREGNFVKWYDSRVKPEDPELMNKVSELLDKA
jgi:glutathione peroxidase